MLSSSFRHPPSFRVSGRQGKHDVGNQNRIVPERGPQVSGQDFVFDGQSER